MDKDHKLPTCQWDNSGTCQPGGLSFEAPSQTGISGRAIAWVSALTCWANFAAAAAKPVSMEATRVPSRTGRSCFGRVGVTRAAQGTGWRHLSEWQSYSLPLSPPKVVSLVFLLLAFYKARFCFPLGKKLIHKCPRYTKHTLIKG